MQTKQSQKIADEIDCELHRLFVRLERLIETDQLRTRQWSEAQLAIHRARIPVRELMADDRRAVTIG